MSRLVKTQSIATERTRLMRVVAMTLRKIAQLDAPGTPEGKDMAAFIVMALGAIGATVEKSVLPWEKRDFWVKADQFRREWAWVEPLANNIRESLIADDWDILVTHLAGLGQRLRAVTVPARHRMGEPWVGAWEKLNAAE